MLREVELDEIGATAARVEKAFAGTGREISAEDARVAATAIERGDRLATADLQFYKRARDLGIDVDYIGTGNAADKAAAYKPIPTKMPPP